MTIIKFALPEGCDMKITTYGAAANIVVTYRGEELTTICRTFLGTQISARRSVLGVNYSVSGQQVIDGEYYDGQYSGVIDYRGNILYKVKNFRSAADILEDNMAHFSKLSMSDSAIEGIRDIARRSFDQASQRIRDMENVSIGFVSSPHAFTLPDNRGMFYRRSVTDPVEFSTVVREELGE